MPLTFAHPLAVLPLRRTGLPLAALVIGSMVPDVVLFAPWLPFGYDATHHPLGILTLDVAVGALAWVAWTRLLLAPLVDAAPAALRARLPAGAGATSPARLAGALVVGATTHVVWDAFTHPGRWGTRAVPWLGAEHAGLPGAKWAQYASGVGGLLALAVVAGLALRRAPARPVPRRRPRLGPLVGWAPVAAGVAAAVAAVLSATGASPHDVLYDAVTRAGAAAAAALLLAAAAWHLAPRTG